MKANTFLIISLSVLRIVRNVSYSSCGGNQNTRFMFSNFFPPENHAFYDNVEKHGRAGYATDDIIRRMCFACWITKVTNTHSEYVIFPAFPLQQWLRECSLGLGYTFMACLVYLFCVHS